MGSRIHYWVFILCSLGGIGSGDHSDLLAEGPLNHEEGDIIQADARLRA